MANPINPHDKFFRSSMKNTDLAQAFFRGDIPNPRLSPAAKTTHLRMPMNCLPIEAITPALQAGPCHQGRKGPVALGNATWRTNHQ